MKSIKKYYGTSQVYIHTHTGRKREIFAEILRTCFIPKEPCLYLIINSSLGRLASLPASPANDRLNYGS